MTRVSEQLWVCRWPADVNDLDWALYAFAPDLTPKQFDALRRMLLALDRSDEPPRRPQPPATTPPLSVIEPEFAFDPDPAEEASDARP